MPENFTAAEAAILDWARREIARLHESPRSGIVSVLLIGDPEPVAQITHEIEDHCPGFGTIDERVFLNGDPDFAFYTNRLL